MVLEGVHGALGGGGQDPERPGQIAGFVEMGGHQQRLVQAGEQRIGGQFQVQEAELGLGRPADVLRAGQDLGQELVAIADAQDRLAGGDERAHQAGQGLIPGLGLGGRGHRAGDDQVGVLQGLLQARQIHRPDRTACLSSGFQLAAHHPVEVLGEILLIEAIHHQDHASSHCHSRGRRRAGLVPDASPLDAINN